MFCIFKLTFDVDILAFFYLATVLATFSTNWVNFFQSSGHTVSNDPSVKADLDFQFETDFAIS
jgi:hypothetical protein